MLNKFYKTVSFYVMAIFLCSSVAVNADSQPAVISGISPQSATVGDYGLSLTLVGTNFLADAKVYFDNAEKKISYNSPSQLTVFVEPADITSPGLYNITIVNATGEKSNQKVFTVNSPIPTIDKISPSSAIVGNVGFNITVQGTNFISGSVVKFNGLQRSTTYNSSSQLTAYILPSDLVASGTSDITVINPAPGGGTSNSKKITIGNPLPTINSIYPETATPEEKKAILTIRGLNFIPPVAKTSKSGSIVYINNSPVSTIYNSANELTAYPPAPLLNTPGDYQVKVYNQAPAGGFSNIKILSIKNPTPNISAISTQSVNVGDSGFELTIIGSRFRSGSIIVFNGRNKETKFHSANKLVARILASDISKAGNYNITVTNPSPGGGTSNSKTLDVNNRLPIITTILPKSSVLNNANINLTVNGFNFVSDAVVNFNGSPQKTTYISSTRLTAFLSLNNLTDTGFYNITVTNPSPGGGNSIPQIFTIDNLLPVITSISQDSILAGSPSFFINVFGNNFTKDTVINLNKKPLVSIYYNATNEKNQSTALIEASAIKNPGIYYITATNPPPGGGISNKKSFTVIESAKDYAYSSCYLKQCLIFSSPIPINNDCSTDVSCK